MSASKEPRPTPPELVASIAFCVLASALLLIPSLGGYGFIGWALHPLLTLAGVFAAAPFGLFAYARGAPREASRVTHGLAMGGAFALMVVGAGVAWYIHAAKSHAHLPAWTKPLPKILHVYGAYAVLALFALQAVAGALKARRAAAGGARIFPWHGAAGPAVWAAAAAVAASGLYLPFVLAPAGNPAVGALLIGGALAIAAAVVRRVTS